MADTKKRVYVLIYSSVKSRDDVREIIKKMDLVLQWRYDLPNCFYLTSWHSANELSDQFREVAGEGHGKFLISEVSDNKQGWLTEATWHMLNKKELQKKQ